MKSLSINSKFKILLPVILFLAVILILGFHLNSVKAQGVLEPQLVTATRHFDDCAPAGDYTLEIFNVGSQGGEVYSEAVYRYPNTSFVNLQDGSIACVVDNYSEIYGTFTGGPNGVITFPPGNSEGITTCQVMDGKTIECNYVMDLFDLGVSNFTWDYIIQNPEAFQSNVNSTVEPTASPGAGCTPSVRGLDPAKPGDVISPGASYVDAAGKETGIIQERWYFNGKESTSIVWDGNLVTVELQWTCLDHSGFSRTFSIPSYQELPVQAGGESESNKTTDNTGGSESQGEPRKITPLGLVLILGAVLGALGVLGAVGIGIWSLLKPKPAMPSAPPPSLPRSPGTPVNYTPASPPVQYIPPTQPEPPLPRPPAQPAGLTNAQRSELTNIRGQMENEVADLKSKWRANRDAVKKLKEILQKNLLKFTFKKGFDVSEWVVNSPAEVITKLTLDPLMEKVFDKHDTAQDSNIVLKINNRIQQLQNEMQDMVNQEKYLQTEISKINQKLG